MVMGRNLVRAVQPLVDFVYPPRCASCGIAVTAQDGLCAACWGMLEVPALVPDAANAVPVHAATIYNDASRKLVLAYKHGGRIALARLLARLISTRLPDPAPGREPPLLIPVPLHRWRLWQRSFNQAALLAQESARMGKGEAVVDALIRHKRTPALGGLGRDARQAALTGAIRLNPARTARIAGRDVVLVDDVLTSGATSRACLAAIAAARPASVAVACFALVDAERRLEHP